MVISKLGPDRIDSPFSIQVETLPNGAGWNMNLAEKIVCTLSAEGDSLPTLAEVERVLVTVAIARHGMAGAWRVLGIGKTTLYRKAHEYRIPMQAEPWPSPLRRRRILADRLERLLLIGRESADYLLRCVGRAKQLGAGLDRELKPFEAPPVKKRALGSRINDDLESGDAVAPGKLAKTDSSER